MIDAHGADATPLTPAERDGLIPTHITLRSELNELEQERSNSHMARPRGGGLIPPPFRGRYYGACR